MSGYRRTSGFCTEIP